jgi:hypothetical protein
MDRRIGRVPYEELEREARQRWVRPSGDLERCAAEERRRIELIQASIGAWLW